MNILVSINDAEVALLAEANRLIGTIRTHAAHDAATIPDAIATLARLRQETYEDINQVQHEYFILQGAKWLLRAGVIEPSVTWRWNPRQTGTGTEPDLAAMAGDTQLVSAEVTTSTRPIGKIAERMASTLEKLSKMPGKRYYFVCSPEMARRATTKVSRAPWDIEIVCL